MKIIKLKSKFLNIYKNVNGYFLKFRLIVLKNEIFSLVILKNKITTFLCFVILLASFFSVKNPSLLSVIAPGIIFLTQYYIVQRNSIYDRFKIWEERLSFLIPEVCKCIVENNTTELDLITAHKIFTAKVVILSIKKNNPFILLHQTKKLENIIENIDYIYRLSSGESSNQVDTISRINMHYTLILNDLAKIL